ncbi:MAG TPA: ribose 5-phosphate isomerase B [Candidatus Ozemobacteraceae bacterium]|nr:ribose 5-phosphate isomerase B [Candidatus Ozemobacteraceae bacterium]
MRKLFLGEGVKIFIGSDHAGFGLKNKLMAYLQQAGHEVSDLGTHAETSCDYADFAHPVCKGVLAQVPSFGILICGSGIGMSMAANRHHGIRAALCHNSLEARLTREHNDANVLVLGARIIGEDLAKDILDTFLRGTFAGGRHQARVAKIESCT